MKITKNQLRRIISEAIDEEPFDITKIEPGVGERIGYDYTVTERRPSVFQGIGGQPMERVAFEYRITPDDDTIVYGNLPAVPKGMPLKDFFDAGLNGGFPDMYPPIPPQNVATGTAKGMPKVGETIKENKMKITKRQLRRIIKEEKARILAEQAEMDQDAYDEASELATGIIEDVMNNYGFDPAVLAGVVQALRDAAQMAENDDRLMG